MDSLMVFVDGVVHVNEQLACLALISHIELRLDLLLLRLYCPVVVWIVEPIEQLDLSLPIRNCRCRLHTALLLSGDELGLNRIVAGLNMVAS